MNNILDEIKKEMGYSNMEDAEFLEMAEYYDNLDDAEVDNLDDAEYAEYMEYMDSAEDAEHKMKRARGHRPLVKKRLHPKHRSLLGRHGNSRGGVLRGKRKLEATGGGGRWAKPGTTSAKAPNFASPTYIQELMTRSKGDLNITITRNSAGLAFPLPFILFGLNGFSSSYISTIKQYLPSGVTMVASVVAATGDVLLTYTDGIATDTVTISLTGSLISYKEFLDNMNSNFFKTQYIRQEYPDVAATLLAGVSQPVNFGLLSALGAKNANTLLPRARRLTSDFNKNMVNLFITEQKITSDFSFVQNIIAIAGYTIAYDVFMSQRINLNNM